MKWIKIDCYQCTNCGYILTHPEYLEYILNCPKCGEKPEEERAKWPIPDYDDHTVSGLLDD